MKPFFALLACVAAFAWVGPARAQVVDPSAGATGNANVDAAPATPARFDQPSLDQPNFDQPSFDQQFQVARELAISGQREPAITAYSQLLLRSPGNADVLLGRGRVYAWMGRWPEAEADLQAATAAAPDYADAWSGLGDMYLWSDRPDQAVQAYGRWIALAANDPAAYIARGRARRAAGDSAGAKLDFDAAGGYGADPAQVVGYLQSLQPRALTPDVVVPQGYRWSSSLSASRTWLSPVRSDWSDYGLSLRRHFERGSLAVEWLGADRFGLSDRAWALDAYVNLWSRAYANLRYQVGPDAELFPGRAWRAELWQGLRQGWELSGSYDHLAFRNSEVDIYAVGVGKYVGNFYLRGRALYIPGDGSDRIGYRGQVRYYYAGDGDNYVEINGGTGRSSEFLSRNPDASHSSNSSVGIAFVKFLTPRWGFKLGLDYSDQPEHVERSISGAVYTRW